MIRGRELLMQRLQARRMAKTRSNRRNTDERKDDQKGRDESISNRRKVLLQKLLGKRRNQVEQLSFSESQSTSSVAALPPPVKTFDLQALQECIDDDDRDERPSKRIKVGHASVRFYEAVPTLSERQQVVAEYSLPVVLPCLFGCFQYSSFAKTWVILLTLGHTLETYWTDFQVAGKSNHGPRLNPLQHHMCDVGWLHTLITGMILMPQKFGPGAVWMGISLILTLPVYLAVSFKSHFVKQYPPQDKEEEESIGIADHHRCWMGNQLLQCIVGYTTAMAVLSVAELWGRQWVWVGLGIFHTTPCLLYTTYNHRMLQLQP